MIKFMATCTYTSEALKSIKGGKAALARIKPAFDSVNAKILDVYWSQGGIKVRCIFEMANEDVKAGKQHQLQMAVYMTGTAKELHVERLISAAELDQLKDSVNKVAYKQPGT